MTMFRYFPGNEGWSYHFAARIVNVAQLGGADFHEAHRVCGEGQGRRRRELVSRMASRRRARRRERHRGAARRPAHHRPRRLPARAQLLPDRAVLSARQRSAQEGLLRALRGELPRRTALFRQPAGARELSVRGLASERLLLPPARRRATATSCNRLSRRSRYYFRGTLLLRRAADAATRVRCLVLRRPGHGRAVARAGHPCEIRLRGGDQRCCRLSR